MTRSVPLFAPREIFEQILKWSVIPTFDLVIENGDMGVLMVKRKIAPYANTWALPGLRMLKNETINDTIFRVALSETGLTINPDTKELLGQYVGRFKTENNRQDLSTGYLIRLSQTSQVTINSNHFSKMRYIKTKNEIPSNIGAMYHYYLNLYFEKFIS
jgi:ADP-ribose pyrophosphatase YjhB (NUDIX family)